MHRRNILIATAVVAIASFLPWANVLGISISGVQGDGIITLILAAFGAAFAIFNRPRRAKWAKVFQTTLAAFAVLVAGYHLGGFAAVGVYLTFFGAIASAVIALQLIRINRQPAASGDAS